ncbi:hypothetical protein D3C80_1912940 [compost metagenome]
MLADGRADRLEYERQLYVLPHRQIGNQLIRLKNKTDMRSSKFRQLAFVHLHDALAGYVDVPLCWLHQSRHQV